MKKDIGEELPQEKLVPDPNRNKSEVEVDAAADQHLEKEGGSMMIINFLSIGGKP